MPSPTDPILYNKIKKRVYSQIPKHSAYRSGILTKTYKKEFEKKYKNSKKSKNPYIGSKPNKKTGLSRWFLEDWRNQRGEIGYKYDSDIYRPTRRITKKTPTTMNELTSREIKRARYEKYSTGRVKKFKTYRNNH